MDCECIDIIARAVDELPRQGQLIKACEELCELGQAICKAALTQRADAVDVDHVAEEMADCLIMMAQVQRMLGIDDDEIETWCRVKLARLGERLDAWRGG